jgi:integrase/recombinase XerD
VGPNPTEPAFHTGSYTSRSIKQPIESIMPSSLATVIGWIDKSIPNEENRSLVHKFVEFMKGTDTSEKYQRVNLIVVIRFARFLGPDHRLSDVKKQEEIVVFLDTLRKDKSIDPDKKWIRTWNDYLQRIKYFMRWYHNPGIASVTDWQTPAFTQIKKKKTNRLSPYVESELWERQDLLTVVKYETQKRNKAALTLLWDLDARNHEVTLLKVKHIRLDQRYGQAEIPYESKTGSGPGLLMCSFPYVRDWLNEHPFRNEPDAMVICNLTTGGPITADTLATIMKQLRKRIIGLIDSGSISDPHEMENLQRLIKTKKWNPYCLRHSAISADSDYLPEFAVRKKARWVMNSRQPSRYINARMGNDLKQKILMENGIITEVDAATKPTPIIADCSRCRLVNPLENKYCSSCGYPLSVAAYEELKAADSEQINQIRGELGQLKTDYSNLKSLTDKFAYYAEHFLGFHPPIITDRQKELHDEILSIAVERGDMEKDGDTKSKIRITEQT